MALAWSVAADMVLYILFDLISVAGCLPSVSQAFSCAGVDGSASVSYVRTASVTVVKEYQQVDLPAFCQ